jgi:hypothetical protein
VLSVLRSGKLQTRDPIFRAIAVYMAVSFIALSISTRLLTQRNATSIQYLHKSTLLYASSDHRSAELASWARSSFQIKTINLIEPGTGKEILRLVGRNKVISPTLVFQSALGNRVVSGPAAVIQQFEPVTTHMSPSIRGKMALAIILSLLCLALLLKGEALLFAAFLPMPGLLAVGALRGGCLSCHIGSSLLDALLPVAMLLYISIGSVIFTIPKLRSRRVFLGFLLVSGCIPAVQAGLLTIEPKLCAACLTFTFVSALYFAASLTAITGSTAKSIAAPKPLRIATLLALSGLFIRALVWLLGYNIATQPVTQEIPKVIGAPISNYIATSDLYPPGTLLVVTLSGCHVCQQTEEDLGHTTIPWKEIPICTVFHSKGCFEPHGGSFPAPMLLISDSSGDIVYQHEGWVQSDEERHVLYTEVQIIQHTILAKPRR